MEVAQEIAIGTLKIVLDHALLHRLGEATEREIFEGYLAVFSRQVDLWSERRKFPADSTFTLISVGNGCIRGKIKVVLHVTGAIAMAVATLVVRYPEYREELQTIARVAAAEYQCHLNQERFICKATLATIELTETIYYTQEGDTIKDVVRRVWHVPVASERQYIRAAQKHYPELFVGPDLNKLRAEKLLIKPTAAMLRQVSGS